MPETNLYNVSSPKDNHSQRNLSKRFYLYNLNVLTVCIHMLADKNNKYVDTKKNVLFSKLKTLTRYFFLFLFFRQNARHTLPIR